LSLFISNVYLNGVFIALQIRARTDMPKFQSIVIVVEESVGDEVGEK
jgi:hypothetical protein